MKELCGFKGVRCIAGGLEMMTASALLRQRVQRGFCLFVIVVVFSPRSLAVEFIRLLSNNLFE